MRVDLKEDLKWDLNQAEEIPAEDRILILQIPEIQEDRNRQEELGLN